MFGWGSLNRGEKFDIVIIYIGAAIIGIGSILFRLQTVGAVRANLIRLEYAFAFLLLAGLLLMRTRARTPSGIFLTTGLSLALAVGVLFVPESVTTLDALSFASLGTFVFFGGVLHYRLNKPTNLHAIAFTGLIGIELWAFGLYYCTRSFVVSEDYLFIGAAVVLTAILGGFLRVLKREHDNSYSSITIPGF